MEVHQAKNHLRRQMKQQRNALTAEQIREGAEGFLARLTELPEFVEAEWIYSFVATGSEPDTLWMIPEFIKLGKRVAVPKVEGEEMEFYEIQSWKDCKPGAFGILEPEVYKAPVEAPGLLLLPGLAFDLSGARLGYGGGFYDRYLSGHPGLCTTALAYEFQIVEEIPAESHDLPANILVTPERIVRTVPSKDVK